MFNDKSELNELALEHPVHRCLMPDRFLLNASCDSLWAQLLGGKHGVRAIGERLRKHDVMSDYPREMRRKIASEHLITMFLCSHESRLMLLERDLLDSNEWATWVLSANTKALTGVKGKIASSWKLDLKKYDLDFSRSVVKTMIDILAPFTNLDFYRGLGRLERDMADFVINAALCNLYMEDSDFVRDFIEQYDSLMERQTGFVLGFNRAYQEHASTVVKVDVRNPNPDLPFIEYWRSCLHRLVGNTPSRDSEFVGNELVSSAQILISMCENRKPGIVAEIRAQIERDENDLIRGIRRLDTEVEKSGLMVSQVSWVAGLEMLKTLEPLPVFPALSKDLLAVLDKYMADRSSTSTLAESDGIPFEESLKSIKFLKAAITEEVMKPASDVERLGSLTSDLKIHTAMFEHISNTLGTIFSDVLKCSIGLRESITNLIENDQPEQPTTAAPTYPDVSEDLSLALGEAARLKQSLEDHVQATNAAQKTAEKLSVELTECRGENHELKRRLTFTPQIPDGLEPDLNAPLDLHPVFTGQREPKPLETLIYFEQIAPDRVVVLPSAKRSAIDADNLQLGFQLAKMVDRLIYPYLDSLNEGTPDTQARNIFGKSYKAKESDGVRQNKRLRAQREFVYEGETHLFERHIGIGRNYGTQHSIRLYFEVIDGKIVIAYCGKHLDSVQTN